MKINNLTPPAQTGQSSSTTRSDGKPEAPGGATAQAPGAVSHVNPAWNDSQQDIDSTRVDAIRQAIAEGRLEFRADQVADQLIERLQELADSTSR